MKVARSSLVRGDQLSVLYKLGSVGTWTDGQLLDRYLARDDPAASEVAFTVLVERHGAMVLSICRQFLGKSHDADDAFQATFLVLVSKASSIRKRESVGGWLLGIARRVAAQAQVQAARSHRHLRVLFETQPASRVHVEFSRAIDAVADYGHLIDEVTRLPELLRSPIVLHYFEETSAPRPLRSGLGCPRGIVLSRLSRARGRIRKRLEQRGVSFVSLMQLGDALNRWLPHTPASSGLAQATVRAARSMGLAGATIESVVPATVATLSRRIARTLVLSEVRVVGRILLLAVVALSISWRRRSLPTSPVAPPRDRTWRAPLARSSREERAAIW